MVTVATDFDELQTGKGFLFTFGLNELNKLQMCLLQTDGHTVGVDLKV